MPWAMKSDTSRLAVLASVATARATGRKHESAITPARRPGRRGGLDLQRLEEGGHDASGERRTASHPRPRRLECGRGAEHRHVVEAAADDLEPDRQAILREAARHGGGGLARQVEGVRENAGGLAADLHAIDLAGIEDAVREGR